ncbi:hypothetical protein MAHJHV51_47070 [Mycobacterium avium subsp. hominissuis]
MATVYRRFRHKRNLVRLTIIDESVRLSTLISDVAGRAANTSAMPSSALAARPASCPRS